MKAVLGLYGVYDVNTYAVENMDRSSTDVNKFIAGAVEDVRERAKSF